jgi:hypothetical protein
MLSLSRSVLQETHAARKKSVNCLSSLSTAGCAWCREGLIAFNYEKVQCSHSASVKARPVCIICCIMCTNLQRSLEVQSVFIKFFLHNCHLLYFSSLFTSLCLYCVPTTHTNVCIIYIKINSLPFSLFLYTGIPQLTQSVCSQEWMFS